MQRPMTEAALDVKTVFGLFILRWVTALKELTASWTDGELKGDSDNRRWSFLQQKVRLILSNGRSINNFRYSDDPTLKAESEEELRSLLMKVKVESEKAGLKLSLQKTKIMASSPITSWEIDGETVETVWDFIWGGSKITADGDCSHEIKRCLLFRRKAMTNLDSILKSRDIALPTKVHLVKAMVFPVVMYECECWTTKKASTEELMFLNCGISRLLRVPWTASRSNQSILKEISPEHSLKGLMLKLKLLYFGHLIRRTDFGKDPDAGKDWRREEKGQQRMR